MGRVDEPVTELLAFQVTGNPDQLVLDTRVFMQEVGQGFGILLLLGQIVDGYLGTLPGNGNFNISSQLSGIEEQGLYLGV